MPASDVSVSPGEPQPGPMNTVGRAWPAAEGSGNQWIRMLAPSNDVRSKSDELPGTAAAFVDCQPPGGWQLCAAAAGATRSQRIGTLDDEQVAPPATTMARVSAITRRVARGADGRRATRQSRGSDLIVPVTASPPRSAFFRTRSK